MKKLLLISFLVLVMAGSAFAQRGMGQGPAAANNGDYPAYNCPYPDCPHDCYRGWGRGAGMGMGMGMRAGGKAVKPVVTTVEQAKKAVMDEIKDLKGYNITEVDTIDGRRGNTSYRVYVKDGGNNTFFYHVNPWGYVRGPVPYTRTK